MMLIILILLLIATTKKPLFLKIAAPGGAYSLRMAVFLNFLNIFAAVKHFLNGLFA